MRCANPDCDRDVPAMCRKYWAQVYCSRACYAAFTPVMRRAVRRIRDVMPVACEGLPNDRDLLEGWLKEYLGIWHTGDVAAFLGITRMTLWLWRRRFGLLETTHAD